MKSKNEIRSEIGKQRAALDFQWLEKSSEAIISNFQTLDVFQSSEIVALYKAIGGEVNLEPLFEICWKMGKRTAIPVFNAEKRVYEMAEISESTAFLIGNYGIQEPVDPRILQIPELDLIAVPGVGFDAAGNRLGRGGGYYDRILAQFSGSAVGICFEFQCLDSVPVNSHDLPVDFLVMETKSVKVSNEH